MGVAGDGESIVLVEEVESSRSRGGVLGDKAGESPRE